MREPFDGPVLVAILNDILGISGVGAAGGSDMVVQGEQSPQAQAGAGFDTLIFTYNIP